MPRRPPSHSPGSPSASSAADACRLLPTPGTGLVSAALSGSTSGAAQPSCHRMDRSAGRAALVSPSLPLSAPAHEGWTTLAQAAGSSPTPSRVAPVLWPFVARVRAACSPVRPLGASSYGGTRQRVSPIGAAPLRHGAARSKVPARHPVVRVRRALRRRKRLALERRPCTWSEGRRAVRRNRARTWAEVLARRGRYGPSTSLSQRRCKPRKPGGTTCMARHGRLTVAPPRLDAAG
ncbi:hypothetical protein K488DRAFT_87007 [Vararia minispora EC-137]|uniref:Uncharacterized protein n=1 Tax=Vararia minispora EC-137 TaxID=1314806 RepID=A0ACB8QI19_9AGAM|nr:hypothetical protein K488DRAFT_87007 [Vararia minispora EC-137]